MSKIRIAVGFLVVFALVAGFAAPAKASTVDELMAQIAELQKQIAALTGGSSTGSVAVGTFTRDLTVGVTGDDVGSLQQMLIDGGYLKIAAPTKYFGPLTKTAVAAWQAVVGLPNTGYFGPMSRAKVAGTTTTTTGTLPAGCTSTAGYSSTTGVKCDSNVASTVVTDGTDGSITASLDSYVGNQTLKKGETKDMYALKLQATVGKVAVNRFDVRMTVRPWLYFSKLILKDSSGNVIAEKAISGASDATELTVGSDYLVRFDNINYVVEPGNDKIVIVAGTVLSTTDKLSSDVTLTIETGSNGIRTTNGKGITETLSESTGRTVTLSSSGSTGNIVARTNSGSPAARIVTTSTSGETTGVVLGVFDFKAENMSSTLNTLKFTMNDKSGQKQIENILKRVWIDDGSRTWNADSVASTTQFSNLTIKLNKDEWKSLTLKADVADADDFTNGAMASTSMVVNATNVVGVDDNYTTVTASASNTIASNDITFLQSGASLSGMTKSVTTPAGANGVAGSTSTVTFTFTMNNTGSNDIYVSKTPSTFVATSTTAQAGGLTGITSGSTLSGDTTTYYVVPSGSTRTFTLSGTYGNSAGTVGLKKFTITNVYFDDDTTGLNEFNINYGLEDWFVETYQNNL